MLVEKMSEVKEIDWSNTSVLLTGGTGSFGRKFLEVMMTVYRPKKIVIFSRDELKQHEMRLKYPDTGESPVRYFIGDVRDRERLYRAFYGIDIVVHAAALKQVPACEYNPFEAIQTNIIGAKNVIDAAIDRGVKRVIGLSSDKAVNPINLYGATKLCAEKLFVQGNAYSLASGTRLACVRYGNVVGSRGSVVPLFISQRGTGRVTITDARMTRFWITVEQGVRFVISCAEQMQGGEVFVPKIASTKLMDLAAVVAPNCEPAFVGVRPGEKLDEVLISADEAHHTLEFKEYFVVQPAHPWWSVGNWSGGKSVPEGFVYSSESNTQWLTKEELSAMIEKLA